MRHLLTLLLLTVPLTTQDLSQFPEAPVPVKQNASGGYEVDKARLVKDRPALTKKFIAAHAIFLGANVFDIEMTHQGAAHHRCVEGGFDGDPHPSRGEMYRNDGIVFAALTLMDFAFQKAHPPRAFSWVPYMGSTYGTAVHLKGGIEWARCF